MKIATLLVLGVTVIALVGCGMTITRKGHVVTVEGYGRAPSAAEIAKEHCPRPILQKQYGVVAKVSAWFTILDKAKGWFRYKVEVQCNAPESEE